MQLSRIDLNLLVAFDAIYQAQQLTRAAKQLHLTQSALSHALGRLRDLFDDPLFARGPRGMVPTPFARQIAAPIRDALAGLERGLEPSRGFDPSRLRRHFHVGLRDVLEVIWLPALVERLRAEAPGVDLTVVRVPPWRIGAELTAGSVDMVADLAVPVGAEVRQQPLMQDSLIVLARRQHPAIGRARQLALATYLRLPHVRVSATARSPGVEDLALGALNQRRRVALRCQSYFVAARVVAGSDLLLTMPSVYAPFCGAGTRTLPLPFEMPPISLQLYWQAASDADPGNRWLRQQLAALAAADHARHA